ncbi:MAG: hypothetical protein R3E77_14645 [Steroidobacteraceae bacterium]
MIRLLPTLAVAACAAAPVPDAQVFLDPNTGVTLTIAHEPIVFARERKDVAANARDYLTATAVSENRAGSINTVLVVYRWSTIDSRVGGEIETDLTKLVVVADGRDIRFPAMSEVLDSFRTETRFGAPPVSQYSTGAFAIDWATLNYMAGSEHLAAFFDGDKATRPYGLWQDGRQALREFLSEVPEK